MNELKKFSPAAVSAKMSAITFNVSIQLLSEKSRILSDYICIFVNFIILMNSAKNVEFSLNDDSFEN